MSINCWSTLSARKPYTNNVVLFLMFNLLDALHWSTKFLNTSPPLHNLIACPRRTYECLMQWNLFSIYFFSTVQLLSAAHPFPYRPLLCSFRIGALFNEPDIAHFPHRSCSDVLWFLRQSQLSWASHRSLSFHRGRLILSLLFIIDVCERITKIGFVIDLRHQNQLMSLGISSTFHSSLTRPCKKLPTRLCSRWWI